MERGLVYSVCVPPMGTTLYYFLVWAVTILCSVPVGYRNLNFVSWGVPRHLGMRPEGRVWGVSVQYVMFYVPKYKNLSRRFHTYVRFDTVLSLQLFLFDFFLFHDYV